MALEDIGRYSAEGFSFYTKGDALLATQEKKKVEYLETKLDYRYPESILRIYNKAIEERVFKSPVGIVFLKKLQDYLSSQPQILPEEIADIPLYASFEGELHLDTKHTPEAKSAREKKKEALKPKQKTSVLTVSVILNIGLVIAVIAMFVITLKSEQPNILNYEQNLLNKYSSWEQELTDKERELNARELELQKAPFGAKESE